MAGKEVLRRAGVGTGGGGVLGQDAHTFDQARGAPHIAEVGLSTGADRPVGVIGLTTQAQLLRPQVTLGGAVWTPAPNKPPEPLP